MCGILFALGKVSGGTSSSDMHNSGERPCHCNPSASSSSSSSQSHLHSRLQSSLSLIQEAVAKRGPDAQSFEYWNVTLPTSTTYHTHTNPSPHNGNSNIRDDKNKSLNVKSLDDLNSISTSSYSNHLYDQDDSDSEQQFEAYLFSSVLHLRGAFNCPTGQPLVYAHDHESDQKSFFAFNGEIFNCTRKSSSTPQDGLNENTNQYPWKFPSFEVCLFRHELI